jgi:uncharacterized phage protein (TIGR01671 family)
MNKNKRIIKFRVWDEKYNCWETDRQEFYPNHDIVKQGRIYQQFTGLLDKNGKEIYEGDIIQDNQGQFYQIVFDDKYCRFDLTTYGFLNKLSQGSYNTMIWESKIIKIIGNIFQNPELLKEDK